MHFTLEENERGSRGSLKFPEYIIKHRTFKTRVLEQIKLVEECNQEATKDLLWDTITATIRGTAIQLISELKKDRKSQIEKIEKDIAVATHRRDSMSFPDLVKRYDDKIKYLQAELDTVHSAATAVSRSFATAKK